MLDAEELAKMLAPIIAEEVERATAPLIERIGELEQRKPEPGPAGEKGEPGDRGEKGEPGDDGTNGKDGAGIVDGFINRDGHLIATLSDGTIKDFGEIVGKDGRDGKDGEAGKDGFSLENFDCEAVDERTVNLKFIGAEQTHSYELVFPVPIYRDVFKEGEEYQRGDLVTWGGSLWHCDKATNAKPGTDDWTLAVKKGRDGKDAKVG